MWSDGRHPLEDSGAYYDGSPDEVINFVVTAVHVSQSTFAAAVLEVLSSLALAQLDISDLQVHNSLHGRWL